MVPEIFCVATLPKINMDPKNPMGQDARKSPFCRMLAPSLMANESGFSKNQYAKMPKKANQVVVQFVTSLSPPFKGHLTIPERSQTHPGTYTSLAKKQARVQGGFHFKKKKLQVGAKN